MTVLQLDICLKNFFYSFKAICCQKTFSALSGDAVILASLKNYFFRDVNLCYFKIFGSNKVEYQRQIGIMK